MNPLGRRTRRADDWASPHERARTRAAQWLDWPLDPAEAAWLESHLGACRACRRRANEYLENRDRLRTLRDVAPPPPRDLWARTAAAIEVESQRRRRAPTRGLPLGALSGIVVIVVVLGATLLSNTPTTTIAPPTEAAPEIAASAAASLLPGPAGTPFLVAAGDVGLSSATRTGSSATGGSASIRSARSGTSTARWFPTRPPPRWNSRRSRRRSSARPTTSRPSP